MIEIIKGSFAAGEVKTFLIQGEYIEILECAYPVDVAMMDRSGAQLSTMRNAEASYFSRPGKYEVIQVTSSAAQTVRLFVGSGDAGTRRTSGTVEVIDGGKKKTLAGIVYGGRLSQEALAMQFAQLQWWNPIGSGKRLIVPSYVGLAGSKGIVAGIGSIKLAKPKDAPGSKLSGGAASGITGWGESPADYVGFIQLNQSGSGVAVKEAEPYVILPGYGFNICAYDVATVLFASVHFFID